MTIHVPEGGGEILERLAGRGGNPRGGHDFLGVRLGRLDLGRRRCPVRTTARPSARSRSARPSASGISGPMTVRSMPCMSAASARRSMVVGGNGEVGGELGGAGIARRAVQIGVRILATEGPAERMLPPPAADDEYPHELLRVPEGLPGPVGRAPGGIGHLARDLTGLVGVIAAGGGHVVAQRPVARLRCRAARTRRAGSGRTRPTPPSAEARPPVPCAWGG